MSYFISNSNLYLTEFLLSDIFYLYYYINILLLKERKKKYIKKKKESSRSRSDLCLRRRAHVQIQIGESSMSKIRHGEVLGILVTEQFLYE